jgi:nicotinate-nucleotide pyrophosphorylase (carboxylating)
MEGIKRESGGGGAHTREVERIVALALAEDLGDRGDITSKSIFGPEDAGAARIIAREPGIVSGLAAGREVCRQVDEALTWLPLVKDGQQVPAGVEAVRLEGRVISILTAERTVLNFLSLLSGVATVTGRYVEALAGLATSVAATRKTAPGLRWLEKQAVLHGGGQTHRQGLYDAVLIKDNHIAAAGSVTGAVTAVRRSRGSAMEIEVEADTEAQMQEAIDAGAARVLLDNMTPEKVRVCVERAGGRVVIEASGGINLDNIRDYAEAGADMISVGALTRSPAGMDYSLEMGEGKPA